jgi:hypothetical protein
MKGSGAGSVLVTNGSGCGSGSPTLPIGPPMACLIPIGPTLACSIPIGPHLACLIPIGLYQMVKEALHERANLLEIAPHLSFPLPIMLPVYRWWQVRSKLFS